MGENPNARIQRKRNIHLSNVQYREIVELSPEPIIVQSNGLIIYANPSAVKMIGAENQEQLIDQQLVDFIHPDDLEQNEIRNTLLFKQGKPSELIEIKLIRLDGKIITVEVKFVPITYLGNLALALLCRDVTEKNETDHALLENEQRYRHLIKMSPEPIVVHSNGILVYLNDSAKELFGANKQDDLIGSSIFDFIHPDQHEILKNRLLQFDNDEIQVEYIYYNLVRLDGQLIETEISSAVVFNYLGNSVIQSVIRDLSARKRNDEFLRKTDKLSAIGQLAAGVAHEVRNPLTSLKGFTQLLMKRHEESKLYLDIMLDELERINFIVNEFMQLAKPQVVEFKEHHLKTILETIISILDTQAIINKVQINMSLDADLTPIYGDEPQLKQVFLNIIKNAIEAMPNGGTLRIQANVQNNHVVLQFIDQGCGIPKDQIPRLGEPFLTTKEKGIGLGLMVSYNIIEAHRGTMFFESELNQGTTVNILLPLNKTARLSASMK
jgi:two-component system sporulation sensor kinase A